MKKMILALMGALALIVMLATSASATNYWIVHDPDNGYAASFTLKCGSGRVIYVPEGHNSTEQCTTVTQIYVHANEEIHCLFIRTWNNTYDSQGWHDIDVSQRCVAQLD